MLYKLYLGFYKAKDNTLIRAILISLVLIVLTVVGIMIFHILQGQKARAQSSNNMLMGQGPPQFLYELYGGDKGFESKEFNTQETNWAYSFKGPLAVTVSPTGEIFVSDTGNSQIQSFNASGQWLSNFGKGKMASPAGIVYLDQKLYIADPNLKKIFVYSEEGKELSNLLDNQKLPLDDGKMGQVIRPSGIQVGPDHMFYITDIANHCVVVLDAHGNIQHSFGSPGVKDGQFQYPNALYVAKNGKIYVSDSNNGRIQIFNREGKFLTKISGSNGKYGDLALPRGIAVTDQGMIYVVDVFSHTVRVYDEAGIELWVFGGMGKNNGEFNFPNGVFIDSQAHIYVTDRENNRVQVFGYK